MGWQSYYLHSKFFAFIYIWLYNRLSRAQQSSEYAKLILWMSSKGMTKPPSDLGAFNMPVVADANNLRSNSRNPTVTTRDYSSRWSLQHPPPTRSDPQFSQIAVGQSRGQSKKPAGPSSVSSANDSLEDYLQTAVFFFVSNVRCRVQQHQDTKNLLRDLPLFPCTPSQCNNNLADAAIHQELVGGDHRKADKCRAPHPAHRSVQLRSESPSVSVTQVKVDDNNDPRAPRGVLHHTLTTCTLSADTTAPKPYKEPIIEDLQVRVRLPSTSAVIFLVYVVVCFCIFVQHVYSCLPCKLRREKRRRRRKQHPSRRRTTERLGTRPFKSHRLVSDQQPTTGLSGPNFRTPHFCDHDHFPPPSVGNCQTIATHSSSAVMENMSVAHTKLTFGLADGVAELHEAPLCWTDWRCPCGFVNFERRTECYQCLTPKMRDLTPSVCLLQ